MNVRSRTMYPWHASAVMSAIALSIGLTGAANAQWQIGNATGDTLRLGYLAQARGEWLQHGDPPVTAQNLFLRHLRVLAAAKLHNHLSMFLGMDSPNLGKALPDGTKVAGDLGIYDFWITYSARDAVMIDVGLIGTPNSHNSIQSISGMLSADFGPYSFLATAPTTSRAGRDYGAQGRGYLLNQHLEYRLGAFQGFRGQTADHPLRYLARLVVDAFRAEKSVYYSGTSLGTQRNLAVGFSVDHQEHYDEHDVDLYADQPLPNGDAVTLQSDWSRYDGGSTFASLPRQDALLAEAGYFIHAVRISPFVQFARRDYRAATLADEEQRLVGLAYWLNGHHLNVKAAFGSLRVRGAPTSTLGQITFQSFEF